MTQYEALKLIEPTLDMLHRNGVDCRDVKYVQLYEDYTRLCREGHKKLYITTYLEEKYGVCMVSIYRIIKRLSKSIDVT